MSDLDTVLRQHVKRTPELPAEKQRVLLWCIDRWYVARYTIFFHQAVWWIDDECSGVQDGQYWLPLPTFDPSEVQK